MPSTALFDSPLPAGGTGGGTGFPPRGGGPKGGTGKGIPTDGIPGSTGATGRGCIGIMAVRCTDTLTVGTLSVDFGSVDRLLTINPASVTA